MARWRTETPLFRKALAAVALWCLLWAVLGYRNHQAVAPYDQRAGYREYSEDVRAEDHAPLSKGMSFQAFRDAYKSPALVYRCIVCEAGETHTSEDIAPEAFLAEGGHLLLLEDLQLIIQNIR